MNYYSGIGSRATPQDIQCLMTKIAEFLCKEDYVLRSGAADGVKRLHARNVLQVYGQDLKTYSDFVICWTDKGLLKGGTATRLATQANIPVFNLAIEETRNRIESKLN